MPIITLNTNILKILSNYVGKLWNILSVFLLVPLYIHYLGIESYGIIGFYSVILGIIGFADAGMSSAITREFALNISSAEKRHLLTKIEIIYWAVIVFICLLVVVFSTQIATNWLTAEHISITDLKLYVMFIGVGASLQLISSLYFGALFGLDRQVLANNYQIIWTTFKSLFVIALFKVIAANLYVFLVWQIICNLIYIILMRQKALKIVNVGLAKEHIIPLSQPIPKRVITYIGGMTFVTIISAINSQSDKLVISYFFSLKIFSYYSIASILSQIPVMLCAPLTSFVFPLLARYSEQQDKFQEVFRTFTTLAYTFIFALSFLIFFYPLEVFSLWSHQNVNNQLADDLRLLIKTLTLGSMLLAMQFPFYYALLAHSKTKYTVYQGVFQVIVGVPLLIICANFFGIKYIGIPWLLINLFAFIYLLIICLRNYIAINVVEFLTKYVVFQLVIGFLVVWLGHLIYLRYHLPFVIIFLLSAIISLSVLILVDNVIHRRDLLSYRHLYNFPRV